MPIDKNSEKLIQMLEESKFVEGAIENGASKKVANELWQWILPFAAYGFNKSHATAYALISYRCAYLKANYPVEYMCALLTSEIGSIAVKEGKESDLVVFLREAETPCSGGYERHRHPAWSIRGHVQAAVQPESGQWRFCRSRSGR